MAEYIERETAKRAFQDIDAGRREGITLLSPEEATDYLTEYLDEIPAADVAPMKHGHWIDKPYPNYPAHDIRYCSECGWNIHKSKLRNSDINWNYCPHCGAKMDRDGDGR